MTKKEAKGFTCECGEVHKFPLYVHAHWDEAVRHTCPKCSRRHTIRSGQITQVEMPRPDERELNLMLDLLVSPGRTV